MSDRFHSRLSKQVLISAVVSVTVGFGVGFAVHALWRRLRNRHSSPKDVVKELSSLKSEIEELKRLLSSIPHRSLVEHLPDEIASYQLSDEDEEFFDIDRGEFNAILPVVALPKEIQDELDQIAAMAMGEDSVLAASTPKAGSADVDLQLGSQAYAKCLVYRKAYRRSPEFLWRFARATYLASTEATAEDDSSMDMMNDANEIQSVTSSTRTLNDLACELTSRRQFVEHGLSVARRALALAKRLETMDQPSVTLTCAAWADIYKWLAVLVGLACEFVGMKQRIIYGVEFKELIDKAIELNPDDCHSHHLRGRWAYQVYNLTWIERSMASRLFATPPTATLDEAIADFEEVERLRPEFFAANLLYLAKCSISKGDYMTAATWLQKAKDLIDRHRSPVPHLDDLEIQTEIADLYPRYTRYL